MEADKSPTPNMFTILGFSLVGSRGVYRGSYTIELSLMKIIKNDLPFSLVDSESFRDSVHYLRDEAPKISRETMRRRLTAMYEKEFQTLKEKLDHITGKFTITIDEWRSGNNFNFFGITLHFYNNKFESENHILGSKN